MWLFFLANCEKEPQRMDNYLVNFATTLKDGDKYQFQLDNQKILIPKEIKDYAGQSGQRVLLNYIPLNGDTIKIRNASNIFTSAIQNKGYPENWKKDPVKIQSAWVGGSYLNMILEVEYHSIAHPIALLQDTSSATVDLYFSHSRENDPPGFRKLMYLSFYIAESKDSENKPTAFRVFINTYEGLRVLHFSL